MHVGIVDPFATRELRRTVLRPNLSPDDPLPGDGTDAVHLGLTLDQADSDDTSDIGLVVSTCLVLPEPCPWPTDARAPWRLMQMATWPDRRGQGYAGRVLDAAIDLARTRGADLLWCAARRPAEPLYLRHGFRPRGDWFVGAEDLSHRHLELDLGGT